MLTSSDVPSGPRAISVNLALFFAFALCSLVLLTQTLVDITQIHSSVSEAVQPATVGIATNTALLHDLGRTNQLAGHMRTSGEQTSASLRDVVAATRQIVSSISAVSVESGNIDGSVAGIARSSTDVRQLVAALATNVAATDQDSGLIAGQLAAADRTVSQLSQPLGAARLNLDALISLIPSISQQATAIAAALNGVGAHLGNVYANGLVQLANLLPLRTLLPNLAPFGGQ